MTEQPMKEPTPLFSSLRLKGFTAFADASMDFLPNGINVFVGENGTGKTHAMKVLYSFLLHQSFKDAQDWGFFKTLARVMPADSQGEIIRNGWGFLAIELKYKSQRKLVFEWINDQGMHLPGQYLLDGIPRPVFVPAVDMIGHVGGFGDLYDTAHLDFDYTFREIVRLLEVRKHDAAGVLTPIVDKLEAEALLGRIKYNDERKRFDLVQRGKTIPMPLLAEGLRKLSTLSRLITNGSLQPGTVLFWDEPEVNLNPKLMDELVAALLALSRSGVQIFLATHSFIILEELSDASKPGEVRYFGFEKGDGDEGVTVKAVDDLPGLRPNPILDQYEDLSNRKLMRSLGVTKEELERARGAARVSQEKSEG